MFWLALIELLLIRETVQDIRSDIFEIPDLGQHYVKQWGAEDRKELKELDELSHLHDRACSKYDEFTSVSASKHSCPLSESQRDKSHQSPLDEHRNGVPKVSGKRAEGLQSAVPRRKRRRGDAQKCSFTLRMDGSTTPHLSREDQSSGQCVEGRAFWLRFYKLLKPQETTLLSKAKKEFSGRVFVKAKEDWFECVPV
jgi:hypothetical protein